MRDLVHFVALLMLLLVAAPGCGGRAESGTPAVQHKDRLTIAQWNVENLFDPVDDPTNPGDDEFTPGTWRQWTPERYHRKVANLADILARVDADVVCLEEVENRRVLDDLNLALIEQHHASYPYIVHRDGPDHRGIDVALMSRYRPVEAHWLTPLPDQREVIVADLAPEGQRLVVMVNHWKSRLEGEAETAPLRTQIATVVRAELDRLLAAASNTAIVVAGDFNDNFDCSSIHETLLSVGDRDAVASDPAGRLLYSLHAGLAPDARGTIYYRKNKVWDSFDSMSVSRSLLSGAGGWQVAPGTYAVFSIPAMRESDGTPKSFRRIYDAETGHRPYQEGYSDHFPVRVELQRVAAAPGRN